MKRTEKIFTVKQQHKEDKNYFTGLLLGTLELLAKTA
jgi:hypothetical protein